MPQVSRYVITLNKAQQQSLMRVFSRKHPMPQYGKKAWFRHYKAFRRTVTVGPHCAMVQWSGMWLGIEHDGYTHS